MNKFVNYFDLLKVKTYYLDLSLPVLTEPRLKCKTTKIKKIISSSRILRSCVNMLITNKSKSMLVLNKVLPMSVS